jgi:prophage regulatory protein
MFYLDALQLPDDRATGREIMEAANDNVPQSGAPRKMIDERQVLELIPISRSTLQRWVADGVFPKPRPIGPRRNAFFADEVAAWQATPRAA